MTSPEIDHQGGKAYGRRLEEQDRKLTEINEEFLMHQDYAKEDKEELTEKLNTYKAKFLEFDLDSNLEIDVMSMHRMMEKMGQAKTHLEVQKMIREVDTTGSDTINYREFCLMMLGGKRTILRLILFFESLGHEQEQPTGVAPKRTLDSLP